MDYDEIIHRLESIANPEAVRGVASYGIATASAYGVSIPSLRALAKEIGRSHDLAQRLWTNDNRETRILAALVDDPKQVDEAQVERWARDFDNWEVCDQCCLNLLQKTSFACAKAVEWSAAVPEFVKRAGFVLMACLAVSDKQAPDERFETFFPFIVRESTDGRPYVKKAVNWALRQIGKRNRRLNERAIQIAEEIRTSDSSAALWIAADALRELKSEAVQARLRP